MISVLVPYWKRQAALTGLFENLRDVYGRKVGDHTLEIVVADDGSGADVPGWVWSEFDSVQLLHLPRKDQPLNPCVPINRAKQVAEGEVLVLTNPEVRHAEPTLARMLALLETEDDYVVATCWDTRGFYVAGIDVRYDQRGRLPMPPGAHFHFCAMLHRRLWERAGGFDEDYRHVQGCDDNDWAWRLHRAGARFRLSPSTVTHVCDGPTRWGLPHGRALFEQKWPESARG